MDVPRLDKSHWVRVWVHALIIMVSWTCRLLLEVGRSWEKRGEKTESSEISLRFHLGHRTQSGTDTRLVFKRDSVKKENMSGREEVTGSLDYLVLAFYALLYYKRVKPKIIH